MDKYTFFNYLETKRKDELIKLLSDCYDCMHTEQKTEVFVKLKEESINYMRVNGKVLLKAVKAFKTKSLRGDYYAPFDINSKNFMDVPEKTAMWFEKLAELLMESTQLTKQGNHVNAMQCFEILFECLTEMESGNHEVVFADKYGIWMLPIDEGPCISAYIQSAATLLNPEKYAKTVLPLIERDINYSSCNEVYNIASKAANKAQKTMLDKMMD